MMLMNDKRTNESPLLFIKDSLIGENVKRSLKTLADLRGVFHNCEAYEQMSPDTLLYEVTCHLPVEEGTPGGLYFGITRIYPGKLFWERLQCMYNWPRCIRYSNQIVTK